MVSHSRRTSAADLELDFQRARAGVGDRYGKIGESAGTVSLQSQCKFGETLERKVADGDAGESGAAALALMKGVVCLFSSSI